MTIVNVLPKGTWWGRGGRVKVKKEGLRQT